MKKPAAKKPARPAGGGSGAAVPKKAAPKKPVAKKPAAGRAAVAAHQAHVAHLAHLAHLGLSPKGAPKAAPKKARQLALGDGVACCAAGALAASLRLTGRTVGDGDVLALYRHTADDPDAGATILATLEAASEFGLAGVRLRNFAVDEMSFAGAQVKPAGELGVDRDGEVSHLVLDEFRIRESFGDRAGACKELRGRHVRERHDAHTRPLILGVELPGPHAVLATPDGWWSWGDLYDPAQWPDVVLEEAWALTWD